MFWFAMLAANMPVIVSRNPFWKLFYFNYLVKKIRMHLVLMIGNAIKFKLHYYRRGASQLNCKGITHISCIFRSLKSICHHRNSQKDNEVKYLMFLDHFDR